MKKYIAFLLILTFSISISQSDALQLAIRNIKLGNTYREARDFDNAAKYISLGLVSAKKFSGFDGQYWTAAAYESLGYLYRDMGMSDESQKNYRLALNIYRSIIKQSDGSQAAMIDVLNKVASINSSGYNYAGGELNGNNSISLSGMKLKTLPNDLSPNIKNLVLKNNKFINFPENITKFSQLEYLDLSDNRIRNISESIGELRNLHYLDLSNNKIKELPNSIANLQNLKELNLENNKLKKLNSNLFNLKNLQILNLRNNKLKFQEILNLVKSLPNTSIIFDKYELIDEDEDEDFNY